MRDATCLPSKRARADLSLSYPDILTEGVLFSIYITSLPVQYIWDWLDVRHGPSEAAGLDVSDITQIDPNAEP